MCGSCRGTRFHARRKAERPAPNHFGRSIAHFECDTQVRPMSDNGKREAYLPTNWRICRFASQQRAFPMNPRLGGFIYNFHVCPGTSVIAPLRDGYAPRLPYITSTSAGSDMPLASWQSKKYPPARTGHIDIGIKKWFLHH